MPCLSVIGAQWGDEGKGKITNILVENADVCVRSQGGANAGHTVIIGDTKYVLHQIPTGILNKGALAIIGNGVVLDPELLIEELDTVIDAGIDIEGLRISERAHMVFPYHKAQDGIRDREGADEKIGTTKRGIGPCYSDKMSRIGIRVVDLQTPDIFRARLKRVVEEKNELFKRFDLELFDTDELVQSYMEMGKRLEPYVTDTSTLLADALDADKRILFEGAQGALLDIDHGTYPFVTSSSAGGGGIAAGAGIRPSVIDRIIGVCKAYVTRVGEGPFPTELHGSEGEWLRDRGKEFGATTGRPRRCGWLDMVALRYAARVSGVSAWAVMKLDVLSGADEIKVARAYKVNGQEIDTFPARLDHMDSIEPVYETLPGWPEFDEGEGWAGVPEGAQAFVGYLEEQLGVPVVILSMGPKSSSVIIRNDPWGPKVGSA